MSKSYWTTKGDVRGSCGHKHRTYEAAEACRAKDMRQCKALPGGNSYSDRKVVFFADPSERWVKIYCHPTSLGDDPRPKLYASVAQKVFGGEGCNVRLFSYDGVDKYPECMSEQEFGDLMRMVWERYCDLHSVEKHLWD